METWRPPRTSDHTLNHIGVACVDVHEKRASYPCKIFSGGLVLMLDYHNYPSVRTLGKLMSVLKLG